MANEENAPKAEETKETKKAAPKKAAPAVEAPAGLSTKEVKTVGSAGPAKTIQPGNGEYFIRQISLEQIGAHAKKVNGYHLVLHLEGPDMGEDFEGFFIDPKDESKGRYKGQVARIKTSNWPYSDGKTKSGVVINRDKELLKILKTVCVAAGQEAWFDAADGKYPTIEAFVEGLNSEAPFKDVKVNFCLAGREYPKENGHMGLDVFLPKFKDGVAIEAVGIEKSKLLKYDPAIHYEKAEAVEVTKFAGDDMPEGEEQAGGAGAPPEEFEL